MVVNLDAPDTLTRTPEPTGNVHDLAWWAKPMHNFVDPRPVAMYQCCKYIDRIFNHGGAIVLFSSLKIKGEFLRGRIRYSELESETGQSTYLDNWTLLSILRQVDTNPDPGNEVYVDQRPVNEATPATLVGIKTALTKDQAKKGTRVFRVRA